MFVYSDHNDQFSLHIFLYEVFIYSYMKNNCVINFLFHIYIFMSVNLKDEKDIEDVDSLKPSSMEVEEVQFEGKGT